MSPTVPTINNVNSKNVQLLQKNISLFIQQYKNISVTFKTDFNFNFAKMFVLAPQRVKLVWSSTKL